MATTNQLYSCLTGRSRSLTPLTRQPTESELAMLRELGQCVAVPGRIYTRRSSLDVNDWVGIRRQEFVDSNGFVVGSVAL